MKKWMSMLLALAMLLGVWTVSAAEEAAPSYLTPSVFIENFNAIMEAGFRYFIRNVAIQRHAMNSEMAIV